MTGPNSKQHLQRITEQHNTNTATALADTATVPYIASLAQAHGPQCRGDPQFTPCPQHCALSTAGETRSLPRKGLYTVALSGSITGSGHTTG